MLNGGRRSGGGGSTRSSSVPAPPWCPPPALTSWAGKHPSPRTLPLVRPPTQSYPAAARSLQQGPGVNMRGVRAAAHVRWLVDVCLEAGQLDGGYLWLDHGVDLARLREVHLETCTTNNGVSTAADGVLLGLTRTDVTYPAKPASRGRPKRKFASSRRCLLLFLRQATRGEKYSP